MRPRLLDAGAWERGTLAAVATAALLRLRSEREAAAWIELDLSCYVGLAGVLLWLNRCGSENDQTDGRSRMRMTGVVAVSALLLTLLIDRLIKPAGQHQPWELLSLSALATATIALAFEGRRRLGELSIVAGGFLVLFVTAISDTAIATAPAAVWLAAVLWHWSAEHYRRWQRAAAASGWVVQTHRVAPVRIAAWLSAITVCSLAVAMAYSGNRLGDSGLSGWFATSGGSETGSEEAFRGLGDGPQAVAAHGQANSTAAVDSDQTIESHRPSLFDMFSESLGEPRSRKRQDATQALAGQAPKRSHQHEHRTDKSSNTFAVARETPPRTQSAGPPAGPALLRWHGPTEVRLAIRRFDHYRDGEWSSTAKSDADGGRSVLPTMTAEGEMWFVRSLSSFEADEDIPKRRQRLDVLNLDETHIPAPASTAAIHIRDVIREDFIDLGPDGCWLMPHRRSIPADSVIHLASRPVWREELERWTVSDGIGPPETETVDLSQETSSRLDAMLRRWTAGREGSWQKLQAVQTGLRQEFQLDRSAGSTEGCPIDRFLRAKRGGEHLFATTLALAAQRMGLTSRLVTGFYVPSTRWWPDASRTDLYARDAHVWAEVRLDSNRWIEFDASPGYAVPHYPRSWKDSLTRFARSGAIALTAIGVVSLVLIANRRRVGDTILYVATAALHLSPLGNRLSSRQQVKWTMWAVELRGRLFGCPRQRSQPQRDWLIALVGQRDADAYGAIDVFCDFAERACFSPHERIDPRTSQACRSLLWALRRKHSAVTNQQNVTR